MCGMPSSAAMKACRSRLLDDAVAGVDQHDREVGGRRAGDHVARVADVAGRVGEDERAPRGGEVAVGDVDRDALLALGAQAVGEQREVEPAVAALLAGDVHGVELVVEDRACVSCSRRPISVVLPSSTEPAVAMRSISGGARADQKYPSRLRSSIAASDDAVVGAGLAALGHARGGDLARRRPRRRRLRAHGAGDRHVADGAVADRRHERRLVLVARDVLGVGQQHPVALEHLAVVGEVDRRHLEPSSASM